MKIDSAKIEALRELLAAPHRKIVLVAHTNPDGDAIGASTAWRDVLAAMGHEVTMIVPNKYPYFLDWMPDIREVVIFRFAPERARSHSRGGYRLLPRFQLPVAPRSAQRRAGREYGGAARADRSSPFARWRLRPAILLSAVVEHLLPALLHHRAALRNGGHHPQDGRSALCGHDDRYRQLLLLVPHAGALPRPGRPGREGIDVAGIHNSVYNGYTEDRARLFGYAIHRKMNIIQEGTAAHMSLTEAEMRRYRFQQGDSEDSSIIR